jgi:hypothetical protein
MSTPPHAVEADRDGDELVQVAFAREPVEGEMIQGLLEGHGILSMLRSEGINGPMVGYGALPPGHAGASHRVMVRAERADEARAVLAGTLVEDEEGTWPESANARYLEEGGRKPRGYGLIGAYARIYLWAFGAMALAFGVFLLLHAI